MKLHRPMKAGLLLAAALTAALAVGACGSSGTTSTATPATSAPASPAAVPAAAAGTVTIVDPWVKAASTGMTAVFGTLVNNTDKAVTLVSGATPAASSIELHEVADNNGKMVMREKQGGFVVPPKGKLTLQPGGDHIMIMGVKKAIKPGDQFTFTLTTADGADVELTAVGKEFAGGNEEYEPGSDQH
ncbi:copper chaperone PCu(A)C [Sinosporangium siamense]|uniref:Copper chaperone PCu(A)C n=1 Tax=Sinosporangium siamense TaxID=1367973 RepID=A0A919V5G6_9ACTN|nr:copper chaperone PCu(A)C [Sinosporangium siamense]GII89897.1 hypothetical protein Ssi02_01280 [Sinosporangium siamense]